MLPLILTYTFLSTCIRYLIAHVHASSYSTTIITDLALQPLLSYLADLTNTVMGVMVAEFTNTDPGPVTFFTAVYGAWVAVTGVCWVVGEVFCKKKPAGEGGEGEKEG